MSDFMRIHGILEGPSGELTYITQNVVFDHATAFEFTTSGTNVGEPDGIWIAHNLLLRQTRSSGGNIWYIVDPTESGALPRNNRVFNNIMLDAAGGQLGARNDDPSWVAAFARYSHNVYFGHDRFLYNAHRPSSPLNTTSFETWQTEPYVQDMGSLLVDPELVDVDAGDYRLGLDSPCRNAGVDRMNLRGAGTDAPIHIGPYVSDDASERFGVR